MRVGAKAESLSVLVVGEDEPERTRACKALLELEEPKVDVTEAGSGPGRGAGGTQTGADVVMAIVGRQEDAAVTYLEERADSVPRPTLFAAVTNESQELARRLLRAGADEVLAMPLKQGNLMRALLKVSETRRRGDRKVGGRICSLVSVVGGVGVTTLTANLGFALEMRENLRVGVVDLDLQEGGLGVLLNVGSDRNILALARPEKVLDSMTLEAALTRHPSGMYVLAAPERIEDSELVSDATIGAVLEQMSQLFDYVLIDCGHRVDGNAVAAWERSHELIYVLDQSVGSARCAWRFTDLVKRLGIEADPRMVLNRYNPAYSITETQLTTTLERPIYARVPRDDAVMEKSVALARTPWEVAANSPLARAYEELAWRLSGDKEVATPAESSLGQGLMRRLLGPFAA